MLEHFNHTLDLDITKSDSKFSIIGNDFINYLASIITCKIINAFKKLEDTYGKDTLSLRSCLEDLKDIDRSVNAPFRGDVNDGFWNIELDNSSFRLLVELDLADDSSNTIARKKKVSKIK